MCTTPVAFDMNPSHICTLHKIQNRVLGCLEKLGKPCQASCRFFGKAWRTASYQVQQLHDVLAVNVRFDCHVEHAPFQVGGGRTTLCDQPERICLELGWTHNVPVATILTPAIDVHGHRFRPLLACCAPIVHRNGFNLRRPWKYEHLCRRQFLAGNHFAR